MKNQLFKLSSIIFFIIIIGCENNTEIKDENVLFSCYINGKLYIPEAINIESNDDIVVGNKSNKAKAVSFNIISILVKGDYTIKIVTLTPKLGENILNEELKDVFDSSLNGMIVENDISTYYSQNDKKNGVINFTTLSESSIMGTFECTLFDKNGKELKVTNGKFNL
jgi:hypothetical protein